MNSKQNVKLWSSYVFLDIRSGCWFGDVDLERDLNYNGKYYKYRNEACGDIFYKVLWSL